VDYYQVLGVAYDDPPEKIRSRYRCLTLSTHPDIVGNDRLDEFIRYAEAYHMIGHSARRQRYNEELGIFVKPRSLNPGHDLYQRISISPSLAEQGGIVPLSFTRYEPCSLCWLAGCHRCHQQGMIPEQVCLDVKIMPDTKHGRAIFIEGQGGRSESGGPRGNLFVYVFVR
jgi:DnaJ-class molecular chaperone